MATQKKSAAYKMNMDGEHTYIMDDLGSLYKGLPQTANSGKIEIQTMEGKFDISQIIGK
jgi:hypothetical protein